MGATRLTEIMVGVTGIVMPYALATPPQGWLLCDGSPLAAGTADSLRARLIGDGNPYGSDGGNPRLPDLRGEFVRGLDAGRNIDAGRVLGSAQADAMQGHKHQIDRQVTMRAGVDAPIDYNSTSVSSSDANHYDFAAQMQAEPVSDGTNGTPRTAAETRPRNVAMNYIIKT